MIARIWHGVTRAADYDAYWRLLHERAIPDYQGTPGNRGVRLFRRLEGDRAHFLTLSYWTSLDAVRAFAGDDIELAKYYPEDRRFLLEFERTVQHFEVAGPDLPADRLSSPWATAETVEAPPVRVRLAGAADAPVIAGHRASMFRDMGQVTPDAYDAVSRVAEARLREWLERGEYVGWLAMAPDDDAVIGGAGAQRRQALPHPVRLEDGSVSVAEGRHAIVLNVYTEPAWRRRGVAEALMRHVIRWAGEERLDRLVLHASDEGRPLYQRLGFVATNEMRYHGPLGTGRRP
jgi:GNAT superfamily N-acetyltransferase/heme-degrading monooxygenase HmoA